MASTTSSSAPQRGLVLYITNKNYSSWSLRPWVLLKALSIPFAESLHPFASTSVQDAFFAFSPTGQVPCLHDYTHSSSLEPIVVWDSLAILHHLGHSYPGVWPTDPAARSWAYSAAAEMHAGFAALRSECNMSCSLTVTLGPSEPSPALARNLKRLDALFAEGLQRWGGPFLCGDKFGGVDAMYAPVAVRIRTYGLGQYFGEAARGYLERVLEMEEVKAWVDAGQKEVWRDELHESECMEMGVGRKLVKDARLGTGAE